MLDYGLPENGSSPVKTILVVRLGAMGDIIHALPAVLSLKRSFPAARITWIVEAKWCPLLDGSGLVDRIVRFHRHEPGSWMATRKELRTESYDLAVDFQGLIKSALIAWLARPGRIVGYAAPREKPAGLFYSTHVTPRSQHVVDQAVDLVRAAGASNIHPDFPLPPGTPEGNLPAGPFVLASPLAGWTSKQWPLLYYEKLAAGLGQSFGLPLVLNGAPGTVPTVAGTLRHESGIAGLINATRRASLVIGVDSGPLHLAAALGKPGVAIFGPTDPLRNGPFGVTMEVFRQPGAATTYRRGTEIDPSMRAITPEMIMPAIAAQRSQSDCHV